MSCSTGSGRWWPDEDPEDAAVHSTITKAVYAWEQGVLGGTHDHQLGVHAELL